MNDEKFNKFCEFLEENLINDEKYNKFCELLEEILRKDFYFHVTTWDGYYGQSYSSITCWSTQPSVIFTFEINWFSIAYEDVKINFKCKRFLWFKIIDKQDRLYKLAQKFLLEAIRKHEKRKERERVEILEKSINLASKLGK